MKDRAREELGRAAMALPGWKEAIGMLIQWSLDEDPVMPLRLTEDASDSHPYTVNPVWSGVRADREYNDHEIDPDWCWVDPGDPTGATGGCLLRLLQPRAADGYMSHVLPPGSGVPQWRVYMTHTHMGNISGYGDTLACACIDAAKKIGRWPGGDL